MASKRKDLEDIFILDRWRSRPEDINGILGNPNIREVHLVWRDTFSTLKESELDQSEQNDKMWEQNGVDLSVLSSLPNLEVVVLEGIHTGHDGHWNYQLNLTTLGMCKKLKRIWITGIQGISAFKQLDLTPLSKCSKLEEIKLDTLSLRYLDLTPLSQNDRLRTIHATLNSELCGVTFPSCPSVEEIDLSRNRLITQWMIVDDYDPVVIRRPQREWNMLSYNQILNLDQLRGLKHLKKLNLGSNKISVIDLSFLSDFDRLPSIDLTSNPLRFVNVAPIVNNEGEIPPSNILLVDDDVAIKWSDEVPRNYIDGKWR